MQDELRQEEDPDKRLQALLRVWVAPNPRPSLDARMVASFRAYRPTVPLWKRFFAASILVPVPVAGLAVLILLSSALLFWHRVNLAHPSSALQKAAAEPPSFDSAEKKEALIARTPEDQKSVSAPKSQRMPRAASRVAGPKSRPRTLAVPAAYWTELDLTGFQPAEEIKVSIIRRTSTNEREN